MPIARRSLLLQASAAAAAASTPKLPDTANFRVHEFETCLNAGRWHPMSKGAREAANRYQEYKERGIWDRGPKANGGSQAKTKALFAKLIGASEDEIAFVQSTTAGENLVVQSLGLDRATSGNIVTDGLHFEGSLYLYSALRKRGMDVRLVRPREWRVDVKDIERAINRDTRLVAVSLVSYINGFEHDVRAICDIAHRHGALVYVDIIQAAGAVPIDIKALDADFCATASYKWLMGDFGLGFLYVKKELLGTRVARPVYSYRQLTTFENHMFPHDRPNAEIVSYETANTAAGYYEQGTLANGVSEVLSYSLQYIQDLGVANIHKYSQGLIAELRREMPKLGFPCITPESGRGPLVAFALSDPAATVEKLQRANIDVTVSGHRMRVSPSVYNTAADLDRLFRVLK